MTGSPPGPSPNQVLTLLQRHFHGQTVNIVGKGLLSRLLLKPTVGVSVVPRRGQWTSYHGYVPVETAWQGLQISLDSSWWVRCATSTFRHKLPSQSSVFMPGPRLTSYGPSTPRGCPLNYPLQNGALLL